MRKRIPIVKIPLKGMAYMHSFGLAKDHLVVVESAVHFSAFKMMLNYTADYAFDNDSGLNTLMHIVDIRNGEYTTVDTGEHFQVVHTGNG